MGPGVQNSETTAATVGGEVAAQGGGLRLGLGGVRHGGLSEACGIGGAGFVDYKGHLVSFLGN